MVSNPPVDPKVKQIQFKHPGKTALSNPDNPPLQGRLASRQGVNVHSAAPICRSPDVSESSEQASLPPKPDPQLVDEEDCLDSAQLLGDKREIRIRHGAEIYRLRLTRSGKLILHK